MPVLAPIRITHEDHDRLRALLDQGGARDAAEIDALEEELARATIVDRADVGADVVTMHSRVTYRDESRGQEREVTLVFPAQADAAQGRISVRAPRGAALLGLTEGQAIDWPLPGGRTTRIRIVAVHEQPEAELPGR